MSASNSLLTRFLANNTINSGDEEILDKEYVSDKEGPNSNTIYLAPLMFLNALTNSFYNMLARVSRTSLDGNPLLTLLSLEA